MFVVDSPSWAQTVVPNLPIKHRDEYILRLAEFAPKTTWLEAKQVIWGCRQAYYAFPFIRVPEDFDFFGYEDHVIKVEEEMMRLYPNELSTESFM